MTEEERKKLLEDLLLMSDAKHYGPLCRRAFDEIEQLVRENKAYTNHCEHLRNDVKRLEKEIKHRSKTHDRPC
jgi:polyhydroxyalkanoate synthesis regulator phasin